MEEDQRMMELTLPRYLKDDIENFVQGKQSGSSLLDCLWGEVYGSINSAYYDNEISEEQAKYLRKEYLGI